MAATRRDEFERVRATLILEMRDAGDGFAAIATAVNIRDAQEAEAIYQERALKKSPKSRHRRRQPLQPLKMLAYAEAYWAASRSMMIVGRDLASGNLPANVPPPHETDPDPLAVGPVLEAFSLEILLKCLIWLVSTRAVDGHDLLALFDELSPAVQREIAHEWSTITLPTDLVEQLRMMGLVKEEALQRRLDKRPERMRQEIDLARKRFERMRYEYERSDHDPHGNIDEVIVAVRKVIDRKLPKTRPSVIIARHEPFLQFDASDQTAKSKQRAAAQKKISQGTAASEKHRPPRR